MLWYDTILAIADFSHPALKSAKDLLERGERENCARKVIEHFRHRTAPEYLFDADDLRRTLGRTGQRSRIGVDADAQRAVLSQRGRRNGLLL